MVGDREQLSKVLSVRSSLPYLRAVVVYGQEECLVTEPGVLTWDQLLALGRERLDDTLDLRLANIAINQVCNR